MSRFDAMVVSFEEITILGNPALFTPVRIDRSTVPDGYWLYEMRHDDDCQGDVVHIAIDIVVNHWGSIILLDEIELPPDGYLGIDPMDVNYGTGECRSMAAYMSKYPLEA